MSKIYFTLFSQAYYVDTNWGFGCPSGGIRNMGELAHYYNIPVTWLLSPKSARCEQEMLTEYHEKFGDEAAMMFRFPAGPGHHHSNERDVADALSIDEYRVLIRQQKAEIEKYLPWADIKVCGQGIRTDTFTQALALEGFVGVYGHCYCQVGTDSITDFGMPWGSFPMRPNSAHLPARSDEEGPIAFEWTMRDLNRSMHTTRPELWSTDPNDVERGGVCSDDNVEYWKNMFREYQLALPYNEKGIWFQFHQEAHEQTWGEVCKPFTEDRVNFCTTMMDNFFEWVVEEPNIEFLTATQAALHYKEAQPKGTIPMYVPYKLTEIPQSMEYWDQIAKHTGYGGGAIHKNAVLPDEHLFDYLTKGNGGDFREATLNPPWKDSFFYFDGECQLVFDNGQIEPFILLNYVNYTPSEEVIEMFEGEKGGGAIGFYIESQRPKVNIQNKNNQITLEITSERTQETPFGVFLWESEFPEFFAVLDEKDLSSKLEKEAITIKKIENRGLFLRFMQPAGKHIITLF